MALRHRYAKRIGSELISFGPMANESDIGRHNLETQHQTRLHQSHHVTKAAFDVLRTGVAKVAPNSLDAGSA